MGDLGDERQSHGMKFHKAESKAVPFGSNPASLSWKLILGSGTREAVLGGWEPACHGAQVTFAFEGDELQLHRGQDWARKASGLHPGGGLGALGWLSPVGASWEDPCGITHRGCSWQRASRYELAEVGVGFLVFPSSGTGIFCAMSVGGR